MNERKRVFLLIFIMAISNLVVAGVSVYLLYNTAFEREKARLMEIAHRQARLIEAVGRFDAIYSKEDHPGGASMATLTVIDANKHYKGFSNTGEFTLARREGDLIVYLISHRHYDFDKPKPVSFDSEKAEPMRRALSGQSGIVVGKDYRGEIVLAAYEPVAVLNLGIVVKIDLVEIRSPFLRSGLIAVSIMILVVLSGASLFFRVSNPTIRRLQEQASELEVSTESLVSEIEERKKAEEALRKTRDGLEQRVKDRTAELLMINEQLKLEIKKREVAQELATRLGRIVDNSLNEIYMFDAETLRFVQVNVGARKNIGYDLDELQKMTPFDIKPEFTEEKFKALIEPLLSGDQEQINFETVHMRKDGSVYPVEVRLQLSRVEKEPIFIAIVLDIAERKNAEKIKDNLTHLKDNLIKSISVISGELDLETTLNVTLDTAKNLLGAQYAALGLVEKGKIISFITSGLSDEEKEAIGPCPPKKELICALLDKKKTIMVSDIASHQSSVGFPKNHPKMTWLLSCPILSGDKHLGILYLTNSSSHQKFTEQDQEILENFAVHATIAINNARLYEQIKAFNIALEDKIKERTKQLEEAIRIADEANKAKTDFLASMSHELRTPLTAIIGFSDVLYNKYFGPLNEKQEEYIRDIRESGKHLHSLINDILDLSKVEAGKMELELSEINPKRLLENSIIMIKEKAMKHGIRIDLQIPDELSGLEIQADERKIKQVIFNLLSNAAKFTPDGGAIEVEAKQVAKELMISVSDTGIGIAPEDQEKIFEEFYQVNGGKKDKTPGSGLGLPLSRRLVEMHGGIIWVESEGEGKGSRFYFKLPLRVKPLDKRAIEPPIPEINDGKTLLNHLEKIISLSLRENRIFSLCCFYPEGENLQEKISSVKEVLNKEKRTKDLLGMDTNNNLYLVLQDTNYEGAKGVCNRIIQKVESMIEGLEISYSTATFPEDGEAPEELIGKVSFLNQ